MNGCVVLFILNHLKSGRWEINSLLEKQNHPWWGTSTWGKVRTCPAPGWGASLHSGLGHIPLLGQGCHLLRCSVDCLDHFWKDCLSCFCLGTELCYQRNRSVMRMNSSSSAQQWHTKTENFGLWWFSLRNSPCLWCCWYIQGGIMTVLFSLYS